MYSEIISYKSLQLQFSSNIIIVTISLSLNKTQIHKMLKIHKTQQIIGLNVSLRMENWSTSESNTFLCVDYLCIHQLMLRGRRVGKTEWKTHHWGGEREREIFNALFWLVTTQWRQQTFRSETDDSTQQSMDKHPKICLKISIGTRRQNTQFNSISQRLFQFCAQNLPDFSFSCCRIGYPWNKLIPHVAMETYCSAGQQSFHCIAIFLLSITTATAPNQLFFHKEEHTLQRAP